MTVADILNGQAPATVHLQKPGTTYTAIPGRGNRIMTRCGKVIVARYAVRNPDALVAACGLVSYIEGEGAVPERFAPCEACAVALAQEEPHA